MPVKQIVVALLVASPLLSFADDTQLSYFEAESKATQTNRLASSRDWFGRKIDNAGTKIDNFFMQRIFGDEVIYGDLPAKNKAKFFFEIGPVEREGIETKIGLDIRLTLPNTKKRLKFVATSNDDNDNRINETVVEGGKETDDFFTGFQYLANEIAHWKPTLQLGAKWSRNPELFLEGRLRRRFGSPQHNISLSHSTAFYSRRHLINTVQVNYFKKFNDDWGFGLANQVRHFNDDHYYAFSHVPNVQHRINDRNAIIYQVAAEGNEQQHPFIDSYAASLRWRRLIHSNWLFIEIVPSHTYFVKPHLNNKPDTEAAILFRLEALINND